MVLFFIENEILREEKVLFESVHNFKGNSLWGQLGGWFKQTVVNPEASLSQDRRGTLSYPSFEGFSQIQTFDYPFQKGNNKVFIFLL